VYGNPETTTGDDVFGLYASVRRDIHKTGVLNRRCPVGHRVGPVRGQLEQRRGKISATGQYLQVIYDFHIFTSQESCFRRDAGMGWHARERPSDSLTARRSFHEKPSIVSKFC
jgi:hypothetical protein